MKSALRLTLGGLLAVGVVAQTLAQPAPKPEPAPEPESLRKRKVPEPSNLKDFVKDKEAAILLGKALFWDMQVGSDGITSCASCHFHAGADNRAKNQVSPGLIILDANGNPTPDFTFQVRKPNGTLQKGDFPFHKLSDINDRRSNVISSVNDVASSQGVVAEQFKGFDSSTQEIRAVVPDPLFNVKGLNTRRVEPRNTPTVINAVFNLRNFWDGRAQDRFNGINPFGRRDKNAKVWRADKPDSLKAVTVDLNNASLASQAVGPPLSDFEMSAAGRTFADVGRKLLVRRPLAKQRVHWFDSVLGKHSLSPLPGLSVSTYAELVRKAFHPAWWQGTGKIANYTHMEQNFSLFFGLSVQLYEATLVSDQTPFDDYAEGKKNALTSQQKRGMDLFFGDAKCANCHGGAEFTKATVHHIGKERIEKMLMGDNQTAIYDNGFYNIGVRPTNEDIGLGGKDPFGFPLSESRLARDFGSKIFKWLVGIDPNEKVKAGDRVAANGAFKTPGLRNIELTAPYFHNGGQRTLKEVVDFYNRGGDFHDQNIADLDPDVERLGLSEKDKEDLVEFMRSLTDERVRYRRAPFDHPELLIPNGHLGDENQAQNDGSGRARDQLMLLPATGRFGRVPLRNFLE
jgi:cytochrome c peroxidase